MRLHPITTLARRLAPLVAAGAAAACATHTPPVAGPGPQGSVLLANGWRITPAGRMVATPPLPLNLAVAPDGRVLELTSGYGTNGLFAIDPSGPAVVDSAPLIATWLGLAVTRGGDAFVSGGASNRIWRLRSTARGWEQTDSVALAALGAPVFAAGLALDSAEQRLAVAGNLGDSVYLLAASPLRRLAAAPTGDHPYTVVFSRDGGRLYVSNWGDSTISVYGVGDSSLAPEAPLLVAPRPSAMVLSPDGRTLYVASAAADEVSVVDLVAGRVASSIALGLTARAPHGTGPNALALAPDGRTLYVANADNNDVAVVSLDDADGPRVRGLIPTAWYPTSVAVSPDGHTLYVGNAKGTGAGPNPRGPTAPGSVRNQYIAALIHGSVSVIPVPDADQLRQYTHQVFANSPYRDALLTRQPWPRRSPIPRSSADTSPIRHAVYIIRENRTYDQVLGDDPRGNGDPTLAIFGDSVTPNAHALARQFVLFDNFYVDGDVSADGHLWTDASIASDYNEKNWPAQYSRRRPLYDFDAGLPVNDPLAGYLWDAARAAGLPMRNYGEMTQWDSAAGRATPEPKGLQGVSDPRYPGFVLEIPDSVRADEFIRELHGYERAGRLPRLMILWLPRDHTYGVRPGRPTPRAMVAENDRALGRIVAAISASRFWDETAIFVLEDDAQNGPDHVDAHRSPLLVASPWVRHGMVSHDFYTTAAVLRTIELILGIGPMSQYDAGATPLFAAFTTSADSTPYVAIPSRWPLDELNPPRSHSMLDSGVFLRPDMADENVLNREIWASVKATPMPAPRHSVMSAAR